MLYNFKVRTIIRVILIIALAIAIAFSLRDDKWPLAVLMAILLIGVSWSLFHYIGQTNRDLASFLKSIQYNDFTATTSGRHKGRDFKVLHDSFNLINKKFQEIRADKEANHQFLQAIVAHIDIGLLGYNQEKEVILMNKALQRMLHRSYLVNLSTLQQIDEQLWKTLTELKPGERELIKLKIDGKLQQLAIRCTELKLKEDLFRLVSFQNIQPELEEQELVAWKKLIRILTHEIMNSVAPIASLSSTISGMIDNGSDIETAQIKKSLQVINKRSEGLLDFTETYRTLTRIPPPRFQEVNGKELIEEIATLITPDLDAQGITLNVAIPNKPVCFQADPALLEQVLINLLRNASDAVNGNPAPEITLRLSHSAAKAIIIIADNGCGISEEDMEQIFVPFFTTKEHGSGIGLSLSRQIIRLHKGTLDLQSKEGEGTVVKVFI
jgi:two-component system nitrogen regulation sensor histidine kinase NtrY